MKIHLKLKGKAICGQKQKKNRLKFADNKGDVCYSTCKRCQKAVER